MVKAIEIDGRRIGEGQPCFVIAEIGVNHNGDLDLARRLIDAAAVAGVDAVKFQTYTAERLVARDAPKAAYQERTTPGGESQFEMLKRLELTEEMHRALIEHCRKRELTFLSTPFEEESVDRLITWGLKALKLPSGELNNLPFLQHVAEKNVPVILSTGMGSMSEVGQAVEVFRASGNMQLLLLHCVSNYPANPADCNLRAMASMKTAFGLPVGFSDHTEGIEIALAAVALGGCVIEKHFTLDRHLPGPDHQASLEPKELSALVSGIRAVESALGDGEKLPRPSESNTAEVARKSIVAATAIPMGCLISAEMLTLRRPGTGLPPPMLSHVTGRRARSLIPAGTMIALDMLG